MPRLVRRIRTFMRRDSVEAAMDAEMRYHIDCEIAERVRQGMSREDATRTAMRDFGGVEGHKEAARDTRGFRPLDDGARDAAYAVRVLRRNPGFTAAVIVTFALGIGCTSAIFTLVNGILLRSLPYADPGRLVVLWERNASHSAERNVVSVDNVEAWRTRARSFSGMAALVPAPVTLNAAPAERLTGAQVSTSFFHLLGVTPALGRDFTDADGVNGGAAVVVLSDALWRTRFGADPTIVGRPILMDGRSFVVVGVMPAAFDPPRFGWMGDQALWVPSGPTPGNRQWGRYLHVVARLRPSVTIEGARAEMSGLADRLALESPDDKGWSAAVVPLAEQITGDVRKPLLTLFAAVLLLLLMSAVNVANLVTTFARRRRHELAVRRAIGATQFRLLRQQLTQSALLGVTGTTAGLAVAVGATRILVSLMPPGVPRLVGVHVDATVVVFASLVACLTTIIVGCAAAVGGGSAATGTGARFDLIPASRATARLSGSRIVAAEIAIGLVLSVVAALMGRSLANLRAVDLGFQAGSVVTGRVSLPDGRYPSTAAQTAFFAALLERARAIPGVTSASIATTRPLACCAPSTWVRDPSQPGKTEANAPTTDVRFVDGAYFATMRIPILSGGALSSSEPRQGQPRTVISRSLARALWGTADPVGRTVSMALFDTTVARVIGVVGDVHLADPRTPARPSLYLSTDRYPSSERDVIVRGSGSADALLGALRQALASLDNTVPLYRPTSLEASVALTVAQDRFTTVLLGGFAVLSLVLAAVGVYGVLSGDVARRRKEIGIRLALGAGTSSVTMLVLRRAMMPAIAGVVIGIVVALTLSRSMSALVFGVGTSDPWSFVVVTIVLLGVAAMATLIPAVRATRVSPLEAIRTD